VEGEDGRLHGEGRGESQEQKDLRPEAQMGVGEGHQVEGEHPGLALVDEGHGHDPHQEEGRTEEGVEEELHGRVGPAGVAPPGHDEVHRHQRQFEEQEEQDEVEGHEAAQTGRFEQQQPGHERARVALDLAGQQHQREQHGRHQQ
jgi:hypothetical protein